MATVQMVATTNNATVMAGVGDGQSLKSKSMTYAFSAAVTSGTILQGPLIQAGSVVVLVEVFTSGISTATINAGDDLDIDRFIAGGTGAVIRTNVATGRPYLMTKNDTIDITTGTADTTATGEISITVYFQPRNT